MADDLECAVCGLGDDLFFCARCKTVCYCSRDHQRKDWKQHKKVCGKPKATGTEKRKEQRKQEKAAPSGSSKIQSLYSGGQESDVAETIQGLKKKKEIYYKEFTNSKKKDGWNEKTLGIAIKLLNSYLAIYKLKECQKLLDKVYPLCEIKGIGGDLHVRALQIRAFLKYKKHEFPESLADFKEFKKLSGPSAELSENIGHVYNTLGEFDKAELHFKEALEMMKRPGATEKTKSNLGGVYLGLGLVYQRKGQVEKGLKFLNRALKFFKNRYKNLPHSLVAKTMMSIASCHEKLNQRKQAIAIYREAVQIFKVTTGSESSPLTASAIHSLAKILNTKKKKSEMKEARELLPQALNQYVNLDCLGIYLLSIIEIMSLAKNWAMIAQDDNKSLKHLNSLFKPYMKAVLKARQEVKNQKVEEDASLAIFYKTAGEIAMLAGEYQQARGILPEAMSLMKQRNCQVDGLDTKLLINECQQMLKFTYENVDPKDRKTPEKKKAAAPRGESAEDKRKKKIELYKRKEKEAAADGDYPAAIEFQKKWKKLAAGGGAKKTSSRRAADDYLEPMD